ncbi:hypothetical protein AYI69_g2238 [Smittium culicis]|uniref:Transcription factor domain-containing protein n=1 Tax=Smittium culicis TaxID=133412 RepID=A0A1R1YN35_9FUNG|nr:hypothetical protein AYI69_g2238 [Smittium culicis]
MALIDSSDNGSHLPIPCYKNLKIITVNILLKYPNLMIPLKLPSFLHNLKHNLFPKYFLHSFLAAGCDIISENLNLKNVHIDHLYADAAVNLIKLENGNSDPHLIWAITLLSIYHWKNMDRKQMDYLSIRSQLLVHLSHYLPPPPIFLLIKKSKLYKLDSERNFYNKLSPEDMEFNRRVWWTFYIFVNGVYNFTVGFPVIQDRDINVKYPTDDYYYRYGGEYNNIDKEIVKLNAHANKNKKNKYNLPSDNFSLLIATYRLFSKIISFTSTRWISKKKDQNKINANFIKLCSNLKSLKSIIDTKYPTSVFIDHHLYFSILSGFSLAKTAEFTTTGYTAHQLYHTLQIVLYQSEIVRMKHPLIHPKRIKTAKLECLKSATELASLFAWKIKNIPKKIWGYNITAWKIHTLTILSNFYFLSLKNQSKKYNIYEKFIKNYKASSKSKPIFPLIDACIHNLLKIKNAEFIKYDCLPLHLADQMAPYSISQNDLYPWIVPKYSSFCKFVCCFSANFSSVLTADYLFLNDYKNSINLKNININPLP